VIRIVDGLALCFEALHKAGYLYRDLNLDHVMVGESGIGLVDYEWCVKLDTSGSGHVDSRAGTWETMAPEEFEMGNVITSTSNIYTLGTVLLQLATRRNPFFVSPVEIPDFESQRLRAKELHQQLPGIHTADLKIDRILKQALQPTPGDRYQFVEEFRNALIWQ
jgi:serine/threonine protein kinase